MRKMIKCEKERIKLKCSFVDFVRFSALLMAMAGVSVADAAQAPNPRNAVAVGATGHRTAGNVVSRGDGDNAQTVMGTGRMSARSAVNNARNGSAVARSATVARSAANNARSAVNARNATNISRAATVARSATGNARMGANVSNLGLARAGAQARATAVFTDISKIGSGYAACRDAYATCMDQFCANANDTYRRCYCSERFTEFRDTELALDEAKTLLMQFEDTSLNAVDKTAAEVDAMYSATIGEAAIKKDTSGAQKTLDEISNLLSGKRKASSGNSTSMSLGVMSLDFSTGVDDIWGGGGTSSIFDTNTGVDLTALEGKALFDASNKQCLQLVTDSCENSATLNMSTSAYGIMITQDCNAYEKKIDSQREAVKQTVRQAQKILREARLEEYRAHNSQDVNECLDKVRSSMLADTACGANYKRCLDYSGAYVNQTTGEAIYSPRLFELEDLIMLSGADGDFDLLGQNAKFNQFLDSKKMFATSALDTCRDLSDIVWSEFKRSALIEISQAQDELIEATKMSCVSTMKECYDTQSGALKDFDDTTAKVAGALSAYAAKVMCKEKVVACAALYGGRGECEFDGNGHLTAESKNCGLAALLSFVDTVDNTRVAEGCATAIDNYVQELCTPTTGNMKFPWNCRRMSMGKNSDAASSATTASVAAHIKKFAVDNCSDPTATDKSYATLPLQTRTQVEKAIDDIREQLDYQLKEQCEDLDGYWLKAGTTDGTLLKVFYSTVFGGTNTGYAVSVGRCVENSTRIQCLNYNDGEETPMASYDLAKDECTFTEAWYEQRCVTIGGYYDNGMCYVGGANNASESFKVKIDGTDVGVMSSTTNVPAS